MKKLESSKLSIKSKKLKLFELLQIAKLAKSSYEYAKKKNLEISTKY